MKKAEQDSIDVTRRNILKTIAGGTVAATLGGRFADNVALAAKVAGGVEPRTAMGGPYNILFILTDQERYFRPGELPKDFPLPAHERLAKKGTLFENHRINSCVCTPSRSVLYTGATHSAHAHVRQHEFSLDH